MPNLISVKNAIVNTGVNNRFYQSIGYTSTSNRSALKHRACFYYTNTTETGPTGGETGGETGPAETDTEIAVFSSGVPDNTTSQLQIWYDAADNTLFKPGNISDDGSIQQWLDKSSYAHNLNGVGNTKPLYQTEPSLNNLSIVEIRNATFFSINPITWVNNLSGFTYFILFRTTKINQPQIISQTNNNIFSITVQPDMRINIPFNNGVGVIDDIVLDTNWHLITMVYDGNQLTNNEKLKIKFDGQYTPLTFTGTIPATTGTNNTDLYMGDETQSFVGYVAETLIYSATLSSVNINDMEQYLSDKWLYSQDNTIDNGIIVQ